MREQQHAASLPSPVLPADCDPPLLLLHLLRPLLLTRNFIYSLVAGGAVLGAIALAITAVSNFDPVKRG